LFARNGNASFDNVLIRGDDIAFAKGGTPQIAASEPSVTASTLSLTAADLAPIVTVATELWTAALGAGDPRLSVLNSVTILVSDLPDNMLGATTGDTIVLDASAAGWGWFVDPTPVDNREFTVADGAGVFVATPGSAATGHMDLLSTVLHEMGNAMGIAEDQGQDVTGMTLSAGERRLPLDTTASAPEATNTSAAVPGAGSLAIDWSGASPFVAAAPGAPINASSVAPGKRPMAGQKIGDRATLAAGADIPVWMTDFLTNFGQDDSIWKGNSAIRVRLPR
jgi:hypothetical protein